MAKKKSFSASSFQFVHFNNVFLMNRGTRGVCIQSLHLRVAQLPHACRGPWRAPDSTTPLTTGEGRPGAESAAHLGTRGTRRARSGLLLHLQTHCSLDFIDGSPCVPLQKTTTELNQLKEDLDILKEKCELFLRQAAASPSVSKLSSELTVLLQSMSQVYSMSSIYMDK